MKELKTLKDLPIKIDVIENTQKPIIFVGVYELKAEAIKRYKYNLELMQNIGIKDCNLMFILEGKCQELREFFNITEEDLDIRRRPTSSRRIRR